MKKETEYFEGIEPTLIYIARRLKDATALESVLDAEGIDYGVEPDYYTAGLIFRTSRVGAFFYVLPQDAERAAEVLLRHNYVPVR